MATEFSGDRRIDLLARSSDGTLLLYRGNGRGGFVTGTGESLGGGWQGFTSLVAPGDFSGDGKPDILAVQSDGALLLYRGNGDSGFAAAPQVVGGGWQAFTAILGPGDWNGDGNVDLLARQSDGSLLLYRGNGHAGWITGSGEPIGTGWGGFTALPANGDFNGDGFPDILARNVRRRGSCSTAATDRAPSAGRIRRSAPAGSRSASSCSWARAASRRRRRRRPRPRAPRWPTVACGSTPATTASRPAAGCT